MMLPGKPPRNFRQILEKVWWRLKDQIAANRLHGSIDALVAAIHGFFTTFTPEDALRLAA